MYLGGKEPHDIQGTGVWAAVEVTQERGSAAASGCVPRCCRGREARGPGGRGEETTDKGSIFFPPVRCQRQAPPQSFWKVQPWASRNSQLQEGLTFSFPEPPCPLYALLSQKWLHFLLLQCQPSREKVKSSEGRSWTSSICSSAPVLPGNAGLTQLSDKWTHGRMDKLR